MDKTLIVMAAGMGSRYGGLKQLDVIGPSGETIIDYSVYDAVRAGFTKVVFVLRQDILDEFKQRIASRFESRVAVECVIQDLHDIPEGFTVPEERSKPWGTGHAMLSAADAVAEPYLIINADDFYGADAFAKAAAYLDNSNPEELEAGLVGFRLKNTLSEHGTVARGVCRADDKGILLDVEEILEIRRDEQGFYSSANREGLADEDLVSMNMWLFTPAVMDRARSYFIEFLKEKGNEMKSEFYIPLIVNTMIEREKTPVRLLETDSRWFGVTYKEDKPAVQAAVGELIGQGQYPSSLWEEA